MLNTAQPNFEQFDTFGSYSPDHDGEGCEVMIRMPSETTNGMFQACVIDLDTGDTVEFFEGIRFTEAAYFAADLFPFATLSDAANAQLALEAI